MWLLFFIIDIFKLYYEIHILHVIGIVFVSGRKKGWGGSVGKRPERGGLKKGKMETGLATRV